MQGDLPGSPDQGLDLARTIVERVPAMLAYWDRQLLCRFANPAYAAAFGTDPQRVIGASLRDVLGADAFAESEPYVAGALRGEAQSFERFETAPDGTARHRRVAYLPDVVDDITRGFVAMLTDQQAGIEASRLAAIVESSQDAIISKRLDGTLLTWNAAAEALFGYTAAEAIGRSVRVLIPPDRQDEEMRILASIARGERVKPFETVRLAKDGRAIDVSLTISPIRDAGGRIVGASKILRDISDRRHAEEVRARADRLAAENRQIQAAMQLKSQFLASVSHELRTPLNAIIGFADLLQSGVAAADAQKTQRFIGHIAASGRHLLQLINDVLDLAKVESGRFEFRPEPLNMERVVSEVCDIARGSADRKRIKLVATIDAALGEVVLDPVRLKQVLYNYLANAIKFTPDGGRVDVRALAQAPAHVRLEVEDSGIGIAPDQMRLLFQEFTQLDAGYDRRYEGTGLGLALTRKLVEAQGGSVGVASVSGEGSVFHAVLPRVQGTEARTADEPVSGRERAGHLLVIEDDREMRARIMNGLAGAGFQVSAAGTGAEATLFMRQVSFDALTLDLQLPDDSGLAMLARLREQPVALRGPVIGLTAPCGPGRAAAFAIADILGKPLGTDELRLAMQRVRFVHGTRPGAPVVLVIDDDPAARDLMRTALATLDIAAACFADGRDALAAFESMQPAAVILDLMMPTFDGLAMLEALRQLPAARDAPVFLWTSLALSDDEYARLAASAEAVADRGGGDVVAMLERLRAWRPAKAGPPA